MELVRKTIGECFIERAEKSPDKIAVESDEQNYTWKELDDLSNLLAVRLSRIGVVKGSHAAIWSTNSPNWIITFLALIKLGAVPILINTCYSIEELEHVLNYADVEYVFYGEGYKKVIYEDLVTVLKENLKERVKNWIYIGRDEKRHWMTKQSFVYVEGMKKSIGSVLEKQKQIMPEDTAVMMFTSGTTAMPKGVLLSHYNLVNNSLETCEHMKWGEEDKMLIAVPMFHCFGITSSLLSSIHAGFIMHVIEYYKTLTVLRAIQDYQCTLLNGVPSMFQAMIRNPQRSDYNLSSLRKGIIAGSPISPEEYMKIRKSIPNLILHASYGQTETSPCVSIGDVGDSDVENANTAGRIIQGCETGIFDLETGQQVPVDVIGEIRVRGYNVMQGYYNLPEETRNTIDENGWLHTGDLGYLNERRFLYVTGRIKDMIIRGGENISPREIEEIIKRYPGIQDVKVIGLPIEVLQEMVVACIVPKKGVVVSSQGLLLYLEKHLAYYKIPAQVVCFDSLPKTASGKIMTEKLKQQAAEAIGMK